MAGKRRIGTGRLYARTALGGGTLAFGLAALAVAPAQANPKGGMVSAGSASISGQGTSLVQVNQQSDRAVIDWRSFNIGAGEATRFNQPSSSSAILNRIHDQNPSQIMGTLSANGIVALVNPNGMVFGRGSQIDVGSLIATTVDIPNERFLSGQNLLFGQPGDRDASVANQGNITVREGGLAALVAPHVTNTGVIAAKAGRVALGAGEIFTVDLYGDGLVSLAASDRLHEVAVEQAGGIKAEGGTVLLTTAEAKRVMDQIINMDGWVDVSSLTDEAGSIVLHASQGEANVNGKLHADGAVGTGGKLQITGEHVKVSAGAMLTAIGTYGDGDIKIGGDYLGGGTTPRAKTTKIESGATIDAGATANGKGGRVIVWSDERTDFGGMIYGKGGLLGGDGGFVETSSKEILSVHGLVDASAPAGKGGEWLLDPNNVTINATADANVAGAPNYTTTNDSAVVTVASIQAALNAGTSVSITTGAAGANTQNGNITVSNAISKTAGGDASLTLKAHGNIDVNAGINSNTGALDLTLWSDSDNSGSGYIQVTSAAIATNGGDVVMGGGADPALNPAIGNATVDDGVTLNNGDISTGAGSISIRGRGENAADTDNYGVYLHTGSLLQSTSGNITIDGTGGNGTNSNQGVRMETAGTLVTSVDGDISITGQGSGSGSSNNGIIIFNDADITSTGTGASAATVTLVGTGGNGTATNYGVILQHTGTLLSSVDGDISITGQGGHGSGNGNHGIYLLNGPDIVSTGAGADAAAITLDGTGGNGTSGNIGVRLELAGTLVTSADGDISVTGQGGHGSSSDNYGIYMVTDADITSTGTGGNAATITLNGTGGNGTSSNYGIRLTNSGTLVSSADGDITLTGIGAAGASGTGNDGIRLDTDPDILSTGAAEISLTGTAGANGSSEDIQILTGAIVIGGGTAAGDITLDFNSYSLANLSVQTTGDIVLQPRTAVTTVGVAGGGGALDLSAAVLAFMNWGDTLRIGRTDGSVALTVNARNWAGENVELRSGAGIISINGAQTNLDDFTLSTDVDPVFASTADGTGTLTLQTSAAGTTLGFDGGAGAVNYSAADLVQLGTNWSAYQVGSTAATGAMTVNAHSWDDPVTFRSAAGGNIVIAGAQTAAAASDTTFTFAGPATINAPLDLTNASGGTQAITFNDTAAVSADITSGGGDITFSDTLSLGADISTGGGNITLADDITLTAGSSIDTATADIVFAGTVEGAQDFEVTTTGDITFNDDVGAVTRLGDVILDPRHTVASGVFNAASLTLINGTGNVDPRGHSCKNLRFRDITLYNQSL